MRHDYPIIELTEAEEQFAERIAKLRSEVNRKAGTKDQRIDQSRDSDEIELLGIKGEIAFAKFMQIPLQTEYFLKDGPDPGFDFKWNDLTVDVKTSIYSTGVLLFKSFAAFKAKTAVLITKESKANAFRIVGIISRERFFKVYEWITLTSSAVPRPSCKQSELAPIAQLTEYLRIKELECSRES